MIKRKLLFIEDELVISKMCQRILSVEGFSVTAVENGKEAEEATSAQDYDLFLVDIRLPVESGADFYKWLQEKYPNKVKPVIFMTGSVMGGDTMDLLQKSGRPYLLKPFRPDELKNTVNDFISKSDQN